MFSLKLFRLCQLMSMFYFSSCIKYFSLTIHYNEESLLIFEIVNRANNIKKCEVILI